MGKPFEANFVLRLVHHDVDCVTNTPTNAWFIYETVHISDAYNCHKPGTHICVSSQHASTLMDVISESLFAGWGPLVIQHEDGIQTIHSDSPVVKIPINATRVY